MQSRFVLKRHDSFLHADRFSSMCRGYNKDTGRQPWSGYESGLAVQLSVPAKWR